MLALLLPVGAAAQASPPVEPAPAALATEPAAAPDAAPAPPAAEAAALTAPAPGAPRYSAPSAAVLERDGRIDRLRAERAGIGIGGPIATMGAGMALFAVGAGLAVDTVLFSPAVCVDTCLDDTGLWALGATSAVLGAAGITMVAVGVPWLRRRLTARRALGQEIRSLSLTPVAHGGAALSLQGRF